MKVVLIYVGKTSTFILGNAIATYLKITTARLKFKGIGGAKNLPWNMVVNLIPHIESYQHKY